MATPPKPIGNLESIIIDVSDFATAMAFWSALAGVEFGPSYTPQYRSAVLPSGLRLVLQQVPESKQGKNRVHVDFAVSDVEAGLKQVEAIGGRLVERVQDTGVDGLIVCADPDGNEFCLISL